MSKDPNHLHPALKECWEELQRLALSELGTRIVLTTTWRPNEVQAQLYAQGRTVPGQIVTNAKPGQSAHNVAPPQGSHAFDFAVLDANGNITWDVSKYIPVAHIAARLGAESGAFWTNFKDYPHVQMPRWSIGKTYPLDFSFVKRSVPVPKPAPALPAKVTVRVVNASNNAVVALGTLVGDKVYVQEMVLDPKYRG